MPQQIPSKLGRYRILGVLRPVETSALYTVGDQIVFDRMNIATLYRAHDEVTNRDVTIKTPSADVADQGEDRDRELRQRFYREGMTTGRLSHPNIVSAFDVGEDQGISYIVFEALEGRTLREAMEAGIGLRAGLRILLQVLNGLAHVHSNGIIHRDIKPDNIMVGKTGVVKIMNFGIARSVDSMLTKTGTVMGTPAYMSPQRASGHAVDGRSDVFSVGCVLYEMVAGRTPFHGESLPALLFKIFTSEPDMTPIPDGPAWKRLRGVITRALQKNPQDRYPDASAMRADLELVLKELGESADWSPPRSHGPLHRES